MSLPTISSDLPQAHVAYAQPGQLTNPSLGIFKLESGRVTFTDLTGEKLVDVPYENIKTFEISSILKTGTAPGWRKYQFRLITNDVPAKKFRFGTWVGYQAYGIPKEEFKAQNSIPLRVWTAPFKARGIKVINHNTVIYVLGVVSLVFPICMVGCGLFLGATSTVR